MKNIVYFPSFVALESEKAGPDFIQYLKRAIVLGGKFLCWLFGANVFGVEEDPVFWVHLWWAFFTLVVAFAHSCFCFFQGICCFLVYGFKPMSKVFGGRVFGFGIVWVYRFWVETIIRIEGCSLCCRCVGIIVCEFC